MKIPTSLDDIHYRTFIDLLELKDEDLKISDVFSGADVKILRATAKLLKGKVKVLGFYDSHYTEQSKMNAKIQALLERKKKVFKFIYALPSEDGMHLVVSKVRLEKWDPWQEKNY